MRWPALDAGFGAPLETEKLRAKGAHSWMRGAFLHAVFFITMLAGGPAFDAGFGVGESA
jgi:hypothetical protein